eukprot:gene11207-11357_t
MAMAIDSSGANSSSRPIMWLPASWTVGLMAVFLSITMFVGHNVPENYMDEPFHVPMTQLYCKGDFLAWDPKITTFPGLYYIAPSEDSTQDAVQSATASKRRLQSSKQQKGQRQHNSGHLAELWQLLGRAWQLRRQLLSDYCLLLLLPIGFGVFVFVNGGITLGDKEAHAPTSHLMQPLYFGLFTLMGAWPLLLQPVVLRRLYHCMSSAPVLSTVGIAAAGALAVGLVAKYSLVHPYLLADNRHYTFYIWRKVFARHWLPRYCLVPGYVVAWLLLLSALSAGQHWLWVAAYVASCWVTLAPAWLVEFRYFTTPFVLAVLHMPAPQHKIGLWLVIAAYCCVNLLTLWIFTHRPYVWSDGSIARFMW